MLAISKKTDYGLNFLIKLAHQNLGQPVTLTKITKTSKLPGPFLAKLAANLVKAGIIKSREGAGGGYLLAKNPDQITLREILSALEGQAKNLCTGTCNHLCGCAFCATRDIVKPLEEEIGHSLENKTLEDFMGSPPNLSTHL